MMTIKIIVKESDGSETVHLYPAHRINYAIRNLNPPLDYRTDKQLTFLTVEEVLRNDNPQNFVSGLTNYAVRQNMEVCHATLYDDDGGLSSMFITAPATCYIMLEGQTVDRFILHFLE